MKVPSDFNPVSESCTEGEIKEFLVWASPDEKRVVFPEFFRTELAEPKNTMKHIVTDER